MSATIMQAVRTLFLKKLPVTSQLDPLLASMLHLPFLGKVIEKVLLQQLQLYCDSADFHKPPKMSYKRACGIQMALPQDIDY